MPYIIENSSGDPILIPDGGLNQDYSIDLVGRNYSNYGEKIAKTQIDLLNNFATDASPPVRPTAGQLWYDKNFKQIRVHDSTTGAWLPTRALVSAVVPTNTYGQNKAGTTYFNTNTGQFYVNTGADGYQIANSPGEISTSYSGDGDLSNPSFYGTSLRNIFLKDTAGVDRAVLALYYRNDGENTGSGYYQGEEIVAIISGHAEFTVADAVSTTGGASFNFYDQFNPATSPNGIGLTIRPGINARSDSTGYSGNSYRALRADQAYALNTGTYSLNPDGTVNDNGGATIPAGDVFHAGADSIPNTSVTIDLGEPNTIFAEGYIKDLFIGEQGGTGSIQPNGDSVVNIGLELNPIDFIYVDEITVTGNINIDGDDVSIGEPSNPVKNIYANNVTVYETLTVDGYQLPTEAGDNGDQIFLGSAGDSVWHAPYNRWNQLTSGDNTIDIDISDLVEALTPGGTVTLYPQGIDLSANISTLKGEIISIADDDKSQESLQYNASTGKLAYIRVTPFDNLNTTDFVLVDDVNQTVDGIKTFTKRSKFAAGVNIGGEVHYGTKATYPSGITPSSATNIQFKTLNSSGSEIGITFTDKAGIVANDDIVAFSDRNLKENLEPISNALERVSALTGYTFNKIGETEKRTGVVAQEVQQVLPEAVSEHDEHLTVAYGNMVGLLIQAIKELSNEVTDLKKQLGK